MNNLKKLLGILGLIVLIQVALKNINVLDFIFFENELTRSLVIRKVNCSDCVMSDANDVSKINEIQFEILYEVYKRPKGIATFPDGGVPKYLIRVAKAYTWDVDSDVLQIKEQLLAWKGEYDPTKDVFGYPTQLKNSWNGYERGVVFKEKDFATENDFLSKIMIQATVDRSSNQVKSLTADKLDIPFK